MRNMSALHIVLVCLALVLSLVRLALKEHWHINIFEIVLAIAALVAVAFAMRGKQRAGQSTEIATPVRVHGKKPTMLAVVYVLAIAIYVAYLGGQLFHTVIHSRQLAQDEQRWLMTNATIVSNSLRSMQHKNGDQTWSPVWTYTYSVGGHMYRSQSMALASGFSSRWYLSRDEATLNAQLRSDGSVVAVYYDPADPSRSVLDRRTIGSGNGDGVILTLSVVLMMFPVGALALIYVAWKKRKQTSNQSNASSLSSGIWFTLSRPSPIPLRDEGKRAIDNVAYARRATAY
ncbi:UNVERIFIED_ORG: undecaprenyl pyrophosphate phosphatase UppP [Paraburkholderia sediminicola]|nr:undecaprenyl pyrophosphate phosphatase UppP [Paraburkholderia sediminicola]